MVLFRWWKNSFLREVKFWEDSLLQRDPGPRLCPSTRAAPQHAYCHSYKVRGFTPSKCHSLESRAFGIIEDLRV